MLGTYGRIWNIPDLECSYTFWNVLKYSSIFYKTREVYGNVQNIACMRRHYGLYMDRDGTLHGLYMMARGGTLHGLCMDRDGTLHGLYMGRDRTLFGLYLDRDGTLHL